ncbi:TonB-dependent receptor [Luteimonas marina]|nr:TonB-dependent receptor [Luteimonas marina]
MRTKKCRMDVPKASYLEIFGMALAVAVPWGHLHAQDAAAQETLEPTETTQDDAVKLDVVQVRASRIPASISEYPGSLTVIDQESLARQTAFAQDIGSILAVSVPGLSTSPGSVSSFDTTLRGRSAIVLIDGVPISPTLRQAGRDIASIDPSAIEQIDVIRGASAIYGNGGAGGVINYITKRPVREGVEFNTKLGLALSLTNPGDSARPSIMQSVSGKSGDVSFVASGSFERIQSFYDADGDRIPPAQTGNGGLPDSDIANLFGKVGVDIGTRQRIEVSGLYYNQGQDTDYYSTPGNVIRRERAGAQRGVAAPGVDDEGNTNIVFNTTYSHTDVLGSTLRLQGYYQNVEQMFEYDPLRYGGTQSLIESRKTGGRLDMDTTLYLGDLQGSLLWGIDYSVDDTVQKMTDGRVWVPEISQNALGYFAQFEISPTHWLDLQAGIRHETFDVNVASFVSLRSGVNIQGGKLKYSTTPLNAGFVIHATKGLDVFGAFSQGFSLSDVGRALRDSPVSDAVQSLKPRPVIYDNYEAGVRYRGENLVGEISVFLSESDLGVNFVDDPLNPGVLIIDRKPERIHGIEASLRGSIAENWTVGGTLTRIEGKADSGDGNYDIYIDSRRIPPLKLTAFVEHQLASDWFIRLQGLYSGNRDRFQNNTTSTGLGRIDSFSTIDLMTSKGLGPGTLTVGILNVLNKAYLPISAQAQNRADRLAMAPGATMSVQYSVKY